MSARSSGVACRPRKPSLPVGVTLREAAPDRGAESLVINQGPPHRLTAGAACDMVGPMAIECRKPSFW